jgi:hypothetical protein
MFTMKQAKSLLLGSAAGLVAVTAGQAADLPVKAKPVEYVKICSLYGAGFYYMPGTDLCIKIGGWVRGEASWGGNGNMTWGPFNANANSRATSNETMRARGYITVDVRNQTEYGVARAYMATGLSTSDAGLQVANLVDSTNRAFVQWAGMTAGLAQSFYDYYDVPAMQYRGGYLPASDTGDAGWWVWGYTAQFGGGVTATLSTEARRSTQIINQTAAGATVGTATTGTVVPGSFTSAVAGASAVLPANGAYGGEQMGDVVGNLRIDQAWGGAQVMGAVHEVDANYYTATVPGSGHPGNAFGGAVGFGLKLNASMISHGDWFQAQFNLDRGALRYMANSEATTNFGDVQGATEAYGVTSDCVYGGTIAAGNATGCQLTSAWSFNAGYEHHWTPAWHTSLYGAYLTVSYNSSANAMLCGIEGNGTSFGSTAVAGAGCNNNWKTWGIGSRTQWDVTKGFYLGVEVLYQNLHSATLNTTGGLGSNAFGAATTQVANENNWMICVRAHRDFLP